MPVIYIKAVTQVGFRINLGASLNVWFCWPFAFKYFPHHQDKQETRLLYECPIYKTRERGMPIIINNNVHIINHSQGQHASGPSIWEQKKNHQNGFWLELLCCFKSILDLLAFTRMILTHEYCSIIKNLFLTILDFHLILNFPNDLVWLIECSISIWKHDLENVNFLLVLFDVSINQCNSFLCAVKSYFFVNKCIL